MVFIFTFLNQQSFFQFFIFSNKPKCKNILLGSLFFLSLNSYALPVIPDEISIPAKLKNRNAAQIKVVFSSLEKQHNQKTANLWKLRYRQSYSSQK